MRALPVIALLLMTATAGCLDLFGNEPDFEEIDANVRDAGTLVFDGFSNRSTYNTRLIGHHNGFDDSGDVDAIPAGGYYTELEMTDRYVYLARGSTTGSETTADAGGYGGFGIINIEDPSDPFLVGSYDAPTGSDIEVNADETLAFFGTQRNTVQEVAGRLESTQDPRPALPRGIHVVDISDKTAPNLVNFLPLPFNGVHTITYHVHENGNEYLLVATYDFWGNTVPVGGAPAVPPVGPDPITATQRVLIYQVMDGGVLVPAGQYQVAEVPPTGKLYFPHDTYVQVHPLTGQTLMYVSYWDLGLRVVDISDPGQPEELDFHTEFHPSTRGNIHFARPFDDMIANRHITVTEPEIINADETGYFTFIDTTDPTDISKVGRTGHWTLPGDLIVTDLDNSPHNFDLRGGKAAIGHNQAGLWIVDASTADNLMEPKTVGYYMANMERANSPKPATYTWGALWRDDSTIVLSDEGSGLHIIEYTGP